MGTGTFTPKIEILEMMMKFHEKNIFSEVNFLYGKNRNFRNYDKISPKKIFFSEVNFWFEKKWKFKK